MKTALLALALTVGISLLGCSKKPPVSDDEATPTARAATVAPGESVGIAECDEYLQKYKACLKRSGSRAAGSLQAFKAQRESYRIAAGTPEGKAGLPATCRAKIEQLAADKACAGPTR